MKTILQIFTYPLKLPSRQKNVFKVSNALFKNKNKKKVSNACACI